MSDQRWVITIPLEGAARTVAVHCALALSERIGMSSCKVLDLRTYYNAYSNMMKTPDETMIVDLCNQTITVETIDFSATHILVPALSPVTLFTLNLLRKCKVTTIHWFYEDYRRASYWREIISGYDFFCAIQKGPLVSACLKNNTTYCFLPTAVTLPELTSHALERAYDVAFIGLPSAYRIEVLENLAQNGIKLLIAGKNWSSYKGPLEKSIECGEWTPEDQSLLILSRAKIGLNLSYDSPWSDIENVHVGPRIFDIPAAGCILVTEDVPLLRESFPECTLFTFRSTEEVLKCVEAVLRDYPILRPVIEENMACVREKHSYTNRVETLLQLDTVSDLSTRKA